MSNKAGAGIKNAPPAPQGQLLRARLTCLKGRAVDRAWLERQPWQAPLRPNTPPPFSPVT